MIGRGMPKLKPCPFCGCSDLYIVTVEQHGFETVGIFCNACKQTVTIEDNEWEGLNEKTKAKAIESWNRRADEPDLEKQKKPKKQDILMDEYMGVDQEERFVEFLKAWTPSLLPWQEEFAKKMFEKIKDGDSDDRT